MLQRKCVWCYAEQTGHPQVGIVEMEVEMLEHPLVLAFLFIAGMMWIAVTVLMVHP